MKRPDRFVPLALGISTLVSVVVLFVWDSAPGLFPPKAHDFLAAFALAVIALAYLLWQTARRPAAPEWFRAGMLAAAFLFWAANQLWPDLKQATLFNDVAIGLFVLDVFLVMLGWPQSGGSADGQSL